MLDLRLKAYRKWLTMKEPAWPNVHYTPIDFQDISYYSAPKLKKKLESLDEVDPEMLRTFEKLGIPLDEQKRLSNVAVDAVFDSVSVATTHKKKLMEVGIIFCPISEAVQDYPELVEHLFGVLKDQAAVIQEITLDSPAKLILQGEHFDSRMTPPYLFEQYMVPYFRPFAERLHERGKVLACHADADASLLLDLIVEAGFDIAECFVTAPMVSLTLARAREVWGTDVIIWGGIPSVILDDSVTDEAFEAYVLDLFRTIAPGDAFILGVADNVMAESRLDRVERVSEMVHAHGKYPIQLL